MLFPHSDASWEIFSCTVASGVRSSDGPLDGGGVAVAEGKTVAMPTLNKTAV